MGLPQKRIHWTETIDGITYDEDVDIYTSAEAVLNEDGTTLQDDLETFARGSQAGNLEELTTTDKTSLVNAITEVKSVNDSHVESVESMGSGASTFWLSGDDSLAYNNKSVSTLPYYHYRGSAVVLNNEIHLLGGEGGATVHYKWNGSSWSSVSTIPYIFYQSCAVVYNNQIHLIGSSSNKTAHYKWNGSSWVSVSTLPYDFHRGSAVVLNNEIHIMGGYGVSPYTQHYKFNGSSWSSVSTLPYASFIGGGAVVLNNEIHIMGGAYNNCYTKHYKFNGSTWESVSILPYKFYYGSAVVLDNRIHIIGSNITNCYRYTAHYDGVTTRGVSTLPYDFYGGSAVVYKGAIHILGNIVSGFEKYHYSLNPPNTTIMGYVKKDFTIYLPIPSSPVTDNLTPTDEGYLVTSDGYVEIAVG